MYPACVAVGISQGDCCPNQDHVKLGCCDGFPKIVEDSELKMAETRGNMFWDHYSFRSKLLHSRMFSDVLSSFVIVEIVHSVKFCPIIGHIMSIITIPYKRDTESMLAVQEVKISPGTECSKFPACASANMTGACCPTAEGLLLACCSSI